MTDRIRPDRARRFALYVVRALRESGYEAFWAGGCVRDQLLGRTPLDYDVATSASPDEVRRCLGPRRTLAIGESFGVVAILGAREEGQVQVATFRCDAAYGDGRRPDAIRFSTAREDALRRDFTVNGMFYNPLTDEVIDYVGGRRDLEARILRAIGDPLERFGEDKLRMLRAARLATVFGFQIDPATRAAIQAQAPTITVVSGERIAAEMRRILVDPHRAQGIELLRDLQLLAVLMPECAVSGEGVAAGRAERWSTMLRILASLREPTFRVALAALLWGLDEQAAEQSSLVEAIGGRWRLSNEERRGTGWLLAHQALVRRASTLTWPQLQRILIADLRDELLTLADAIAREVDGHVRDIDYCRARLRMPVHLLNPPLLITGDDLRTAGYRPGPRFRDVLSRVRDAQLDGQIHNRAEALALAQRLLEPAD